MKPSLPILVLSSCVLAGACGGARPNVHHGGHAADGAGQEDGLRTRLREIATSLAGAGMTPEGELARGFLASGEPRTIAVDVVAHRCTAFVSLASPGLHDLDATLFAPDGTELASDTEPDAHPTVVACADASPRRAFLHVRAYAGAGAFLVAAFQGDTGSLATLTRVVGGRPGIAGAEGEASQDAERVREFVLGAGRRGFEARGDAVDVPLVTGQAVRLAVPVEPHNCVTVGAFATGALTDVDLRLLDEEGREVARAVSTARDAVAQACADRRAEWTAEVAAAHGEGRARVQILTGTETQTGTAAALWLGDRAAARPATGPPAAPPVGALLGVSGTLLAGETVAHAVTPPRDGCVRIVASPGRGIVGMGLAVRGIAAADPPGGGEPTTLHVCGAGGSAIEVVVSARGGGGAYTLAVDTVDPPAVAPPLRTAVLDADASARAAGFERRALGPAGLASPVAVPAGRCARIVRIAPGDSAAARVALVEGTQVIAEDVGIHPRASACATAAGARTLEARSDAGPGAVLLVYGSAVAGSPGRP